MHSYALNLNGAYIENAISGYDTLYVKGRESLETEIDTTEVGVRDGAIYKNKRYLPRTIIVGFVIKADSSAALILKQNKLNSLLANEKSTLIFADETDKFYTATKSGKVEYEGSPTVATGEIEFYCADPFKYSVQEYTVDATVDHVNQQATFDIDYNGTAPAHPKITTSVNSECGFFAFSDISENIIQIGDPEEADGEEYTKSETLINDAAAAISQWSLNSGYTGWPQQGSVNVGSDMVRATAWGSGTSWHGPSLTKAVPADSNGEVGAQNCLVSWKQKLVASASKQLGAVAIRLINNASGTRTKVAEVVIKDKSSSNFACAVALVLGTTIKKTITYKCTANWKKGAYDNRYTRGNAAASITKEGGTFTFSIGGQVYKFKEAALSDVTVNEIELQFGKYKTCSPTAYNGFYSLSCKKNMVEKWKDVPNKFAEGDLIEIDGNTGSIIVNGSPEPGLGAIGNDWEDFALLPQNSNNLIYAAYSEWANTAPTFTMKYREVFL